jgi:rSAM-associated Gly-rich repeat protein
MSLRQKYMNILAGLVPAGAAGISVLLGSTAPAAANPDPAAAQPPAATGGVADRLAAIRQAVSEVAGPAAVQPGEQQLAWGNWWRNGGRWGNGGFRPFWGNGGWRPWGNWRNGWNNWGNWWRNW